MEFEKHFAQFLFKESIIKFGDFTLSSGKKSPYYIDLRLLSSYPHQFRRMIKFLEKDISSKIGFDNFDSLVSVPTGGLVIASALSYEILKPLIYVRTKPKDYGTSKSIEGLSRRGLKVVMIDDVATTGGSVINAIRLLKEGGMIVTDVFVVVNRLQGASKSLNQMGVKLHSIVDIIQITQELANQKLVDNSLLQKIKDQGGE